MMKNSKKLLVAGTVLAGISATNANTLFTNVDLGNASDLRSNLLSDFNSPALNNENLLSSLEAKCGEATCGEKSTKSTEHKCGEGKCGEGKCGEKAKTDTKSEDKAFEHKSEEKSETKTDSKDKSVESKCGEGTCGSM